MPRKPLRPCRKPGCRELVSSGYCDQHKQKRSSDRSEEAMSWHWFYGTPEWKDDLRPAQLLREPFCEECAKRGMRVRATDVDHREDHKGDWLKFIDRTNLRSLCHSCHSRKTAKDLWQKRSENKRR